MFIGWRFRHTLFGVLTKYEGVIARTTTVVQTGQRGCQYGGGSLCPGSTTVTGPWQAEVD